MYDSPELTPSYTKNHGNDSWQQPIWIAFLASLGIHGMLGINLEKIPLFAKPVKLPPTVGLVELTPEQIARMPRQKTEPELSFSNIQPPSNISQIPQQQQSFPRLPSPPTRTPSVGNLPRTSVGRSSYEIPERPPTRPTVPLRLGRNFPSSVSRLPRNQTPRNNNFTYVPPPTTQVLPPPPLPTYPRPLPNINPPSLPPLPELPQENQGPTEAEIRRSLNLTDDVYESDLFGRNRRGSLLDGLRRPQQRYQDKVAAAGTNSRANLPGARVQTPPTPAEPDGSKVNRLPESPLARRIREGKTLQQVLVEERNQPERVAVVTPENRQPEVEARENPPAAAKVEERPAATVEGQGEFKDLFLAELERSRQQRRQTTSTPEPITTPEPEPVAPTPTVAAAAPPRPPLERGEKSAPPRPPLERGEKNAPPLAEIVENPPVAETVPELESTPKPKEEFKGSLLASLQGDRLLEPETVTSPPVENPPQPPLERGEKSDTLPLERGEKRDTLPLERGEEENPPQPPLERGEKSDTPQPSLERGESLEVPTVEFEEVTPVTPPTREGQGEFKGGLLAKLEQYRRQRSQMDAAGEGVFSAAERLGKDGTIAYTEWAIALGLEESNFTTPTNISDVYPDAACSANLTGRALVGVLVNADGEIIEGPKLLLGSGREVLDEAALSAVSDRSFDASDKSKAYQFAFSFNSSSCAGE